MKVVEIRSRPKVTWKKLVDKDLRSLHLKDGKHSGSGSVEKIYKCNNLLAVCVLRDFTGELELFYLGGFHLNGFYKGWDVNRFVLLLTGHMYSHCTGSSMLSFVPHCYAVVNVFIFMDTVVRELA